MKLKIKQPTTSSQRHCIQIDSSSFLSKKTLIKKKIKKILISSGRNNSGKITVRHKGGGHKRKYREINFYRTSISSGITTSIEYDPNRSSFIASLYDFNDKKFCYIIAPQNLKVGDILKSGPNAEIKIGHSLPISAIPVGSYIYNISLKPNQISKISRAAGSFSKIKEKTLDHAVIELNSKKRIIISVKCYASIGSVSNEFSFLTQLGKAGRSRWLNTRPTVRGVAMNPVDHPHGGGEGKKSGQNKTPWGKFNKKHNSK